MKTLEKRSAPHEYKGLQSNLKTAPHYGNQLVTWNHNHLLVQMLDSYGILESEEGIKLIQRDFLVDFLTSMMETYCSPKNKNPEESLAAFYFRYMVLSNVSSVCDLFDRKRNTM